MSGTHPDADLRSIAAVLLVAGLLARLPHAPGLPEAWATPARIVGEVAPVVVLLTAALVGRRSGRPVLRAPRPRMAAFVAGGLAVSVAVFATLVHVAGRPAPPWDPVRASWVALVVPIAEEAAFRGWVLDRLRRRWGAVCGILSSTALFGLMHLGTGATLQALLLGLACGVLAVVTETLAAPLALHVAWNTVVVLGHLPAGFPVLVSAGLSFALLGGLALRTWTGTPPGRGMD